MPSEKLHYDTNAIHSEEVDDIIGHTPNFLLRYGTVGFLVVLLLFISASWIISYPDTIVGPCTLYASSAPKPVVPRVSGRLAKLFVTEGDIVKANQPLLLIQNTAHYAEVQQLTKKTDVLSQFVQQDRWNKINISPSDYKNIGELQGAFQAFYTAYVQMNSFVLNGQYNNKKTLVQKDLINNDSFKRLLLKQKAIYEKDYAIADSDYYTKSILYREKVIARMELKQEESRLLAKKIPLENMDASLMNNRSTAMSKEREIMELDKQYFETRSNFIQSLNKLASDIELWKQQYLLTAPIDGIVAFTEVVQENQELSSGKEVFYVESSDNSCYAQVLVDQTNFGKLKAGQIVIVRLPSYPFQEYGSLQGKVIAISRLPNKEKQYMVKVALPQGLITNTGHKIDFTNELIADAEIITKKTRLLHKFLYSIEGIFHKGSAASHGKQADARTKQL